MITPKWTLLFEILQQYFALNLDQATQVMLTVHYEGKGCCRGYLLDIASRLSKPGRIITLHHKVIHYFARLSQKD